MGAGKTFIGKQLASIISLVFYDLDNLIEHKTKLSIPKIFETHGELSFRKLENYYLKQFLNENSDYVLATGGGTPVYFDNMQLLKKNGLTIYLKNSAEVLFERLKNSAGNRPLIKNKTEKELINFIKEQLKIREKFYNKADIIINSSKFNPQQTIQKIIEQIQI